MQRLHTWLVLELPILHAKTTYFISTRATWPSWGDYSLLESQSYLAFMLRLLSSSASEVPVLSWRLPTWSEPKLPGVHVQFTDFISIRATWSHAETTIYMSVRATWSWSQDYSLHQRRSYLVFRGRLHAWWVLRCYLIWNGQSYFLDKSPRLPDIHAKITCLMSTEAT